MKLSHAALTDKKTNDKNFTSGTQSITLDTNQASTNELSSDYIDIFHKEAKNKVRETAWTIPPNS